MGLLCLNGPAHSLRGNFFSSELTEAQVIKNAQLGTEKAAVENDLLQTQVIKQSNDSKSVLFISNEMTNSYHSCLFSFIPTQVSLKKCQENADKVEKLMEENANMKSL